MPSATGDAKTLTSENLLDLRGLTDPDITVIDHSGRHWKIAADLPVRAVLSLMHVWQLAQSGGSINAAHYEAVVDGVWALLRRAQPACTRDEVIDAFSDQELVKLLEYVSFRQRTPQGEPNGTAATSATMDAAVTPRPTRSRRRSGGES